MDEEKGMEQTSEDISEKKGFVKWVKEHKPQLMLAGVSVTVLIATILGLKNKDAVIKLWDSLKEKIEKGALYSAKWFEKASMEELKAARETVQKDYMNPELDLDYRSECYGLLGVFDKAISKKEWAGEKYGYPVHREHGWYLSNDD